MFSLGLAAALEHPYIASSLEVLHDSHDYAEQVGLPPAIISDRIDNCSILQSNCKVETCNVKALQYNVQTLGKSRRDRLALWFKQERFAIGCFQECRARESSTICVHDIIVCSSAAAEGTG